MISIKYTLSIILFVGLFSMKSFSQILETKQMISITSGVGSLKGSGENMFFPSSVEHAGLEVGVSYIRKILPWLAGGVDAGLFQFSKPDKSPGFAEVESTGGRFLCLGPQVNIHSPFEKTGIFNRFRIALQVSPQYYFYEGKRSLIIDNEIQPLNAARQVKPVVEMDKTSSGFGGKISPEINYRITQRVGIKVAYNLQMMSVYTGYDTERLISHSLMGGLVVTFGNYKHLF